MVIFSLRFILEFGWEKIINLAEVNWKGKSLKTLIFMFCLGASVYHIWKHRNAILHKGNISTEEQIITIDYC